MIRRLLFRTESLAGKVRQITGISPANIVLYRTALQHSSVSGNAYDSNERMEFLGDAILSAVVANYLYQKFPYKNEGYLTDIRSKMVSRSQLNSIAHRMGIDQIIKYNGTDQLLNKKSMAGNALEAIIGAVYLDKGFGTAQRFILRKIVKPYLDIEEIEISEFNYKSKLLEWAQKSGKEVSFVVKTHKRSKHRSFYQVGAVIDGKELGHGEDTSKKNAEKLAAKMAFEMLNLTQVK